MKSRVFAIVLAAASAGCTTTPPQEPARKPGFLERAWTSTQKGSRGILKAAETGATQGWHSTKDLVNSPFSKKKPTKSSGTDFRNIVTSIQIKPETVRLSTTRSIDATMQITNKTERGLQLSFPTSQHIEVVVKTEDGKVIQRWSEDQRIERETSLVVVNPGERLEYVASISTRNMTVGTTYVIEATAPGYAGIFARIVVVPQS